MQLGRERDSAPCNWTHRLEASWENIKAMYEPEKLTCEGPGLSGGHWHMMVWDRSWEWECGQGVWLATERLGATECEAMALLRWRMVRK